MECAFREQYVTKYHLDANIMAESTAFNTLILQPNQLLEDFHSQIVGKGHRLNKSERYLLYQFIEDLPSSRAFFVRAGMCITLKAAFHSAQ